jgi:photosystem II stability/assembly factor-like uncharacterized protein
MLDTHASRGPRFAPSLSALSRICLFSALAAGLFSISTLTAGAQEKSTAAPKASTLLSHAWLSVGPDGGDARSLAADPKNPRHLYLGTTSSWVYETEDGGTHWHRLAKLGNGDDLIVDNIFVDSSDPTTLVAGVWKVDERGGGIFISHDGGKLWLPVADMNGQSVRALAQAPSNPKIYVAGTLSGVYRSIDGGVQWTEISPADSTELHEIESVAIDPLDTNTIYAGTWHLPWKTTDGGAHWSNIKQGLIDDSDVFSIIVDPKEPSVVYASACSGIYKSNSGGQLFRKVQGIPSTARRTQVIMQDPRNLKIVYAGTTQGLYRTEDAGENWERLTGSDVIVNDLYIDPTDDQRVLMSTQRSGILASNDAGKTFQNSNDGYSQRVVQTLLADHKEPDTLYAGVLNDKTYGGVFVSKDNGATWQQMADGLNGRDVFVLAQAADGTVYAGTNDGIARLDSTTWQPDGAMVHMDTRKVVEREHHRRVTKTVTKAVKEGSITGRVHGLDVDGTVWYAATASGVYRSTDQGAGWELSPLVPVDYPYLDAEGANVIAGQRHSLMLSSDEGMKWTPIPLPAPLSGVSAVTISADGAIWVGGREGVFFTKDDGMSWNQINHLPLGGINSLTYDPTLQRVLVTSPTSTAIFGVDDTGTPWKYWQAGWLTHQVLQHGNRLVAASMLNGVVIQPASEAATLSADQKPASAEAVLTVKQ